MFLLVSSLQISSRVNPLHFKLHLSVSTTEIIGLSVTWAANEDDNNVHVLLHGNHKVAGTKMTKHNLEAVRH